MENLIIGIIDDDSSKVTQIITHLCSNWRNETDDKLAKYADFQFIPVEISVSSSVDDMINVSIKNGIINAKVIEVNDGK